MGKSTKRNTCFWASGHLEAFSSVLPRKAASCPVLSLATNQDWPLPKHKSSLNSGGFARADRLITIVSQRSILFNTTYKPANAVFGSRTVQSCAPRLAVRPAHVTWAVSGNIGHQRLLHLMPTSRTVVSIFAPETCCCDVISSEQQDTVCRLKLA